MTQQTDRGKETLVRLEQALERLVKGEPLKTKPDGRINLKRINDEAGLSSGGIYYYESFVDSANLKIKSIKKNRADGKLSNSKHSEQRLREQRDKEKGLKQRYKSQRDQMKVFSDQIVAHNAQLEFTLFEALEKIDLLEEQLEKYKVIPIASRQY